MYTNTSSPLYRQGQIVMRQLPKLADWTKFINYNTLAAEKDSGVIEAVEGAFLFHKPVDDEQFMLRRPSYPNAQITGGQDYVTDVLPSVGPLVICARVTDPNGRAGYWTPSSGIEFETLNQWFETERVHLASRDLERAMTALTAIPQYHTNDFHLSDLWEGIKSFASDVWSGIKEVVPVVAPIAGMLMNKGGKPVKNLPPLLTAPVKEKSTKAKEEKDKKPLKPAPTKAPALVKKK